MSPPYAIVYLGTSLHRGPKHWHAVRLSTDAPSPKGMVFSTSLDTLTTLQHPLKNVVARFPSAVDALEALTRAKQKWKTHGSKVKSTDNAHKEAVALRLSSTLREIGHK